MSIVLPAVNIEHAEFEVYVIFKMVHVQSEPVYKVVACQNVLLLHIESYYDQDDIMQLHQNIASQLRDKPQAGLKFLFQNH